MQAHLVKESVARAILIDAALEVYDQKRKQADGWNLDEETLWRRLGDALEGIELWICRVYHCGFPPERADERFMEDANRRLGLDSQAPSEIIDRELARREDPNAL
jgi:hypothetical protein